MIRQTYEELNGSYDPRSYERSFSNCYIISFIDSFITGTFESTNDQLLTSVALQLSWLLCRTGITRTRVQAAWKSEFSRIFYVITAKIAFIIARIITSLHFISTVQYMFHFIYHFLHMNNYAYTRKSVHITKKRRSMDTEIIISSIYLNSG